MKKTIIISIIAVAVFLGGTGGGLYVGWRTHKGRPVEKPVVMERVPDTVMITVTDTVLTDSLRKELAGAWVKNEQLRKLVERAIKENNELYKDVVPDSAINEWLKSYRPGYVGGEQHP